MSQWRELWREFIKATPYRQMVNEQRMTNDQFWKENEVVYEDILSYSGYPGEVLKRVSSLIPSASTLLDIGAGTGAFALPLAPRLRWVIALEPSAHQLRILEEKALSMGVRNITLINGFWEDTDPKMLGDLDFSLAAYSMFVEDVWAFVEKMITVSLKGVFLVFRAGRMDSLQEFAYGNWPEADHTCLIHILEEMGYDFQVEVFPRDYLLPLHSILRRYRFSARSAEDITRYLQDEGRLVAPQFLSSEEGIRAGEEAWVRVRSDDALLHRLS